VIVKDASDATLIDTGYPEDHARVLASLTAVRLKPQDVSAVLVPTTTT
jgi:glyoxylase-like metal-dependent hydrolase (beta-lactamase superfamily II)